jgi:hypothetical protein
LIAKFIEMDSKPLDSKGQPFHDESTQENSALTNKNNSKNKHEPKQSSHFVEFCKKNKYKYLKLHPYMDSAQKTQKLWEEYRQQNGCETGSKTIVKESEIVIDS